MNGQQNIRVSRDAAAIAACVVLRDGDPGTLTIAAVRFEINVLLQPVPGHLSGVSRADFDRHGEEAVAWVDRHVFEIFDDFQNGNLRYLAGWSA